MLTMPNTGTTSQFLLGLGILFSCHQQAVVLLFCLPSSYVPLSLSYVPYVASFSGLTIFDCVFSNVCCMVVGFTSSYSISAYQH